MKALVYTDTNTVEYRDEPEPILEPGEVLLKVAAVGICGSDMHAYHGLDARRVPPLILGHEVSGVVQNGKLEGKRAVINPLMTCGVCAECISGRSNLCESRELIGMRHEGALAEYVSIKEQNLIELPDGMDLIKAALAEPAATALHAVNLARMKSPRPLAELKILIIGGGAIGLLAGLLLKGYGCRDITVTETSASRLQSAKEHCGCQIHNPLEDPPLKENVYELVIDAVGGGVTRKAAMQGIKPGGIFVHIGLMDAGGELDIRKLTLFEITLVGVYCYTHTDVQAAVKGLHSGLFGDLNWIKVLPLTEGAQAFDDLDKGRTAEAKVILTP